VIIRGQASIGEHLTLILHLPTFFFPLLVVGEMRWMKDIGVSDCKIPDIKEAGIQFMQIDNLDSEKLNRFFESREEREMMDINYKSAGAVVCL